MRDIHLADYGSGGNVKLWKLCLALLAVFLLGAYVGAYWGLSRRGYDEASRYNIQGFYYFLPEDTDQWRSRHFNCVWLFFPLNTVDRWVGLGRPPGQEPLWRLSK